MFSMLNFGAARAAQKAGSGCWVLVLGSMRNILHRPWTCWNLMARLQSGTPRSYDLRLSVLRIVGIDLGRPRRDGMAPATFRRPDGDRRRADGRDMISDETRGCMELRSA